MAKKAEESELTELARALEPILEKIRPILQQQAETNAPIIRRWQWMNFIVMVALIIVISTLAFYGKIDGSAATGLLGAIIGYVFGYLYSRKDK